VRRRKADELAGGDDLGLLPESREMALVAGDEIIRASSIGALKKYVVIRVGGDSKSTIWNDEMGALANVLKELPAKSFANLELRPRQGALAFAENVRKYVQPGWLRQR
jgi:hypothetical protein